MPATILHHYDNDLIIINPTDKVEKYLSAWRRRIAQNEKGYGRSMKMEHVLLHNVIFEGPSNRTIQTMQGFYFKILKILTDQKKEIQYFDHRLAFPAPQLKLMRGFRAGQQPLLEEFLLKERSGCLKAPTRYGKTTLMVNTLRAFPRVRKVVWAAPGVDLLQQTVEDIRLQLPEREITGIFTGSKTKRVSDDITVCSFDSLHKVDIDGTNLLLVDEPHASVSEERAPLIARFKTTRVLGFGATLSGRFDNMDKLITGLIGPTWVERTFKEGVAEGALSPIRVYRIGVPFKWQPFSRRDVMYRRLVHNNPDFVSVVNQLVSNVIPDDWQTLTFVETKKQAEFMRKNVQESEIAIADLMTPKERKSMFKAMRENQVKRCICTKIYSTGVTFSDLRCIVNACGGGGSISSTQKPGRLAEIRDNKKRGYLFDFKFECSNPPPPGENLTEDQARYRMIEGECNKRFEEYEKLGYEILDVDDPNSIQLD